MKAMSCIPYQSGKNQERKERHRMIEKMSQAYQGKLKNRDSTGIFEAKPHPGAEFLFMLESVGPTFYYHSYFKNHSRMSK